MNTLRLIIKIKYLQLYGRHLARMLVSLKAARLPECPLPAFSASAPAEAFRSGSPHKDSRRWVWETARTFAGCDGERLCQTCSPVIAIAPLMFLELSSPSRVLQVAV